MKISIREAAAQKIDRIRQPHWANPLDHLKIDVLEDGTIGPWMHLYAPINATAHGHDPVDLLWPMLKVDLDAQLYEPYTGPVPK